jgi:acyl carrier protein
MKTEKMRKFMAEVLRIELARLNDEAILTELVNDSFALIDLVIEMQDEFDVFLVQDDLKDVKTVKDLLTVLTERDSESQPCKIEACKIPNQIA